MSKLKLKPEFIKADTDNLYYKRDNTYWMFKPTCFDPGVLAPKNGAKAYSYEEAHYNLIWDSDYEQWSHPCQNIPCRYNLPAYDQDEEHWTIGKPRFSGLCLNCIDDDRKDSEDFDYFG